MAGLPHTLAVHGQRSPGPSGSVPPGSTGPLQRVRERPLGAQGEPSHRKVTNRTRRLESQPGTGDTGRSVQPPRAEPPTSTRTHSLWPRLTAHLPAPGPTHKAQKGLHPGPPVTRLKTPRVGLRKTTYSSPLLLQKAFLRQTQHRGTQSPSHLVSLITSKRRTNVPDDPRDPKEGQPVTAEHTPPHRPRVGKPLRTPHPPPCAPGLPLHRSAPSTTGCCFPSSRL